MQIGRFGDFIKFRSQIETGNCLMPKTHCSSHTKNTHRDTSGFSCVNVESQGHICGRVAPGSQNKRIRGASLVAPWLRICLPVQGTQVRALVWEDPTCRGATRPVSHNY